MKIGVPEAKEKARVSKNRTRALSPKVLVENHGVPPVVRFWTTSNEREAPPPVAAWEREIVSGRTKGVVGEE
jgi:hypothetical protein